MLYIFDLDGTVIDSSHRQNTLPDGSLDLANWIENNTPDKILADSLLPLADKMRSVRSGTDTVAVITARVMGDTDLAFMSRNGLKFDYLYSRAEGNNTPDDLLKRRAILKLAKKLQRSMAWMRKNAIFFDDNLAVLDIMESMGIKTINATLANERLSA
tara:strand:+ start:1365 stop:1838 length:474 start_codon:yes stop_codon:yes gene_type:complete